MLKPLQIKERKRLNLNSTKTLSASKGAAKIFKDYLKGDNELYLVKLDVI